MKDNTKLRQTNACVNVITGSFVSVFRNCLLKAKLVNRWQEYFAASVKPGH